MQVKLVEIPKMIVVVVVVYSSKMKSTSQYNMPLLNSTLSLLQAIRHLRLRHNNYPRCSFYIAIKRSNFALENVNRVKMEKLKEMASYF